MNLDLFDTTGISTGLNGMTAALSHAERIEPEWPDIAFNALADVFSDHPYPMTIEEARKLSGLASPADERAWGGVVRRLSHRGVIKRTGQMSPAASSHGSPKPMWIAV